MPGTNATPVYGWPYLNGSTDNLDYESLSGEDYLLAIEATVKAIADRVAILETGPNTKTYAALSAGEVTSSTSFADLAGASIAFTKRAAATKLQVTLHANFVTAATSRGVEFGVRLDGAGSDYLVASMHQALPGASVRLLASGVAEISGITAGAHTVQVRWRAVAGAGNISRIVSDDLIAFTVTEVTG